MMLLAKLKIIPSEELMDICVEGRLISHVSRSDRDFNTGKFIVNFENAIAFPGFINSHDHLEFNCFSAMGKGDYRNYVEWRDDIQANYQNEISAVLKIPAALRTLWGIYKNLLAGVTTVINHGGLLKIDEPLITVKQEYQNLHSVKLQKSWKWKLNNPVKKNQRCVIHIGEGTDDEARNEIDELIKWNLLKRKLIGVHAVAMNSRQAKQFDAIVWCPESNKFLLNKTADIRTLYKHTHVLFGTDSTLTGNWNIWQQLRLARAMQELSDQQLFDMITKSSAKTWGMNNGEIAAGRKADIVIARDRNDVSLWDTFYNTNPSDILMVIHGGEVKLFDDSLLPQLKQEEMDLQHFNAINMNGSVKYLAGDLPSLMKAIKSCYPEAAFPCCEFDLSLNASHA